MCLMPVIPALMRLKGKETDTSAQTSLSYTQKHLLKKEEEEERNM